MSNIFCGPLWLSILQRICEVSVGGKQVGVFFLADNFFFAEGDKKNYSAKKKTPTFFHLRSLRKNVAKYSTKGGHKKYYSPKIKKIIHQQTKLLIQRKHHYTFDMTFLCPPPSYYFSGNLQTISTSPLFL